MAMGNRLFAGFLVLALAGCGAAGQQRAIPQASSRSAMGNGGMTLPGGNGGMTLPGATLACPIPTTTDGNASCTIALNANVPPLSDPTSPQSMIPGLHPADLTRVYALPSQNAGGTVAVVDAYDDPAVESDLAVYRAAYGLPSCTSSNGCFSKRNQLGSASAYPAADPAWSQEIALDVEMVSAICPACKIVLVEANSASIDDLGAAVDAAAALHPVAISNSYYASEWPGERAEDAHYAHSGIAVTVSAGDQASPFYPAASPYVTAVGGTSLGSGGETPWTYGGRGCSALESAPRWQPHEACGGMRATVDVAAVADPQTGVSMYEAAGGGWLVAGGTSVGAPIVAAAYALSGNPQSAAYAYAHRTAFYDVPPAGYDLPTGLGSPRGVGGL